jgi:hypothetical protein
MTVPEIIHAIIRARESGFTHFAKALEVELKKALSR